MTGSPAPHATDRSSGAVVERFHDLAARILASPPGLGPVRLVAVDGPSGAGKTHFAGRLADALGGAPVVHTDDLLDGWDDQLTFWPRLDAQVLRPLRTGRPARYQRYLWHRGCFGGAPVVVAPAPVVLLEGVTAARAAIRPELNLSVFVTAPSDLRLHRALVRDTGAADRALVRDTGAADRAAVVALRAYLERWRQIEDQHFAGDRTATHVDIVVDGAPTVPHDPATGYVRLTRDT